MKNSFSRSSFVVFVLFIAPINTSFGIMKTIRKSIFRISLQTFLVISIVLIPILGWTEEDSDFAAKAKGIKTNIVADYKHFYSPGNLTLLAAGLGTAGIMANTHGDQEVQDWYQDSVRNAQTDDIASIVKSFGNGRLTIPVLLGTALAGELTDFGSVPAEWARRSLRTMLVGTPPMLFFQNALGASRPNEGNSYWHPFEDDNGVSGHSFMGAVPFLTAAKMAENPYIKSLFYLTSTLCGLSRINDNKHYVSQAVLGWWMANLAASSIDKTETPKNRIRIAPTISDSRIGIVLNIGF